MTNDVKGKSAIFDTADSSAIASIRKIRGVLVAASGDSWVVVLNESASGREWFRATCSESGQRGGWYPLDGITVPGVNAGTLTAITKVFVYFD